MYGYRRSNNKGLKEDDIKPERMATKRKRMSNSSVPCQAVRSKKRLKRNVYIPKKRATTEEKMFSPPVLADFKRKDLCPCLFPHCTRMQHLYNKLLDVREKVPMIKKEQIVLDELQGKINQNTSIELIYHSDLILQLIEENTAGKGHMEGCTFRTRGALTVFIFSPTEDTATETGLEMMKSLVRSMASHPDNFYTIICNSNNDGKGKGNSVKDLLHEGSVEIQETGKSIRAVLSFFIELPIRQKLERLRDGLETRKQKSLLEEIKAVQCTISKRSMLTRMAKYRDEFKERKDIDVINEFRSMHPDNFFEISEPYNYMLERIVSLQNELISGPGQSRQLNDRSKAIIMTESANTKLRKMKEVVACGHNGDMLEIWIDDEKAQQSPTEEDVRRVVKEPCKIRFVQFTRAIEKIKPGDKLYPPRSHGTLALFAESEKDIIGITISHVTRGKDKVYVDSGFKEDEFEERQKELGEVIMFESSPCEKRKEQVAFVRVNESERHRVELQIEKDGKMLRSELYEQNENLAEIKQVVMKKGAKTGWTEGIVKFDKHPYHHSLIVEGLNGEFCQDGDSGSAILRFKPDDPDENSVEIISILSGTYQDREKSHIKGTLGFHLKDPLDLLVKQQKATYILK